MPVLASSKRRSTHRSFLSHFVLWSCSCCLVLLAVSNVAFAQADTSILVSPPPTQQRGAKANAPAAPPPPPPPPPPGTAINHRPFLPGVIDMNAIAPFFPSKSASCQLCKVQFPKLVECNLVANRTLSLIPRFGEFNHISYVNGERQGGGGGGGGGAQLVHKKRSSIEETSPFLTLSKLLSSSSDSPSTFDPDGVNFTAVMPFLQCICPDQRLEATRSCLTCFRVSNQRNFLNDLSVQNVTSSLSAFAQACMDSNNGTVIPPGPTKGSSASESELGHRSHSATDSSSRKLVSNLNWTLRSAIMIIAVHRGYILS